MEKPENLRISLLDNSGKEVRIIEESYFLEEINLEYNMQNLASGIYFIKINDFVKKFIYLKKLTFLVKKRFHLLKI